MTFMSFLIFSSSLIIKFSGLVNRDPDEAMSEEEEQRHAFGQTGFFRDLKNHIKVRTEQDPSYIRKFTQMVTGSFYLGISNKISVEFDHDFW